MIGICAAISPCLSGFPLPSDMAVTRAGQPARRAGGDRAGEPSWKVFVSLGPRACTWADEHVVKRAVCNSCVRGLLGPWGQLDRRPWKLAWAGIVFGGLLPTSQQSSPSVNVWAWFCPKQRKKHPKKPPMLGLSRALTLVSTFRVGARSSHGVCSVASHL